MKTPRRCAWLALRLIPALTLLALTARPSAAQIRITEFMYQGINQEFIEFTNVGVAAIDMTGWSYDDDSRIVGTVSLSAYGLVLPGQSVLLTESPAADFRTAWGLSSASLIIGDLTTNLGRNDEINLFNAAGTLADRLTYGDQNIAGSIRTQNRSGWVTPAGAGLNNILLWTLASSGDASGSRTSAGGDIGNPGVYPFAAAVTAAPEPASAVLLIPALLTGAVLWRRGRP